MDTISSMSWLLPVWIIGAPLVAALVMMMTTPKGSNRSTYTEGRDRTAMPGTVRGRDTPAYSR